MRTSNKLLVGFVAVILIIMISIAVSFRNKMKTNALKGDGNSVEVTNSIASFSKVKISRDVNVIFEQSDNYNFTIEADSNLVEYVNVTVEDSQLEIDVNEILISNNPVNVYIKGQSLQDITLGEGCRFEVQSLNQSQRLNILQEGGTYLFLHGSIDTIDIESNMGSTANIEGSCKMFEIEVNAGSVVNADSLKADNVKVECNMGAICNISPIKTLEVSATAGAVVNYAGTPEITKQELSAGAQLTKK